MISDTQHYQIYKNQLQQAKKTLSAVKTSGLDADSLAVAVSAIELQIEELEAAIQSYEHAPPSTFAPKPEASNMLLALLLILLFTGMIVLVFLV